MNINTSNIAMALFFAIFLLLNIATANLYPSGSDTDEILYIDPAINLAEGNGFKSSAWSSQSKDEFWASNVPLYSLIQSGVMKVFGTERAVSKGFVFILAVFSGIFLSIGLRNYDLIKLEKVRNACVIFFLMIFPVAYSYRSGRPDIISLIVASSTFAITSMSHSNLRKILLILTSIMIPLASLALVFLIVTTLLLCFLFFGRKIIEDAKLIISGIIIGTMLMMALYFFNNSLIQFLKITVGSSHTLLGQIVQYFVFDDVRVISKIKEFPMAYLKSLFEWHYSMSLLTISYLLLLSCKTNRNQLNYFFIALAITIPFILGVMGKYSWHYSWMHISILTVGIFYSLEQLDWQKHKMVLTSSISLLVIAALIGWPWIIWISFSELDVRSQNSIEDFVEQHVTQNDTVVVDEYIYFSAKKRAKQLFVIGYGGGHGLREIPIEQATNVNKAIVQEAEFSTMQIKYGGEWEVKDNFYLELKDYGRFQYRFASFRDWDKLVVYERSSELKK
jgi:hypothetical protein